MSRSAILIMVTLTIACGTVLDPPAGTGSGHFTIVVDPRGFESRGLTQVGLRATVDNVSERDFYARVGDGFNVAPEQENVYAALGTSAAVERFDGARWVDATSSVLIEGSRYVVLRKGRRYTLTSTTGAQPGVYRIRFGYSAVNNDSSRPLPLVDFSPSFRIR
ncbi:MAG: hypothetical protein ACT4OZ_17080 [Gemmatimonadota bacterium]